MDNSQRMAGLIQAGKARKESLADNGKVKEALELNMAILAELEKLLKESN
jgi:hypothetical protein